MRLRSIFAWIPAASVALAANFPGVGPKAELWERWLAHDAASSIQVDHSAWGDFLSKYLVRGDDGVNRLRYAAVTPADRKALDDYLGRLSAMRVSRLRRAEQLPFWINFYNALTVRVVLDHYPVNSILRINVSPGLFAVGPWGKKLVLVEGEMLSLDDIEHRILRPIWRDPRIHYAVNCASVGCPNLAAAPYTAETADAMLTEGARAYVNHPRGARVADFGPVVSSIYRWYKEDFGGTDAGVLAHLRSHAGPELAGRLAKVSRVVDHEYDWSLNDASEPRD
ncbi:MAG: DUF547 domain-containing protein [Candidatus Tectomicrobia bacterium]|uniref:DUF547 domain-containing protein n=1 Tax=Tectimicrobiota bacterium TaxID=2528274 RepID=A0A932MMN6_UNCTE|nr:DUF547 domain-containing protein [Candidatus Tectomicrobia bacterium]